MRVDQCDHGGWKQWLHEKMTRSAYEGGAFLVADFFSHPFGNVWAVQQSIDNGKSLTLSTAISRVTKNSSWRSGYGFYTGFGVQAAAALPGAMLYSTGRELALPIGPFAQGISSVCFGMLAWSPATRIEMLMQASKNSAVQNEFNQLNTFGKIKSIVKKEGVRGLYRGTVPTAFAFSLTDAVGSWLTALALKRYPEKEREQFIPELLSTVAGFSAAGIITSPIEVAAARIKIAETDPKSFPDRRFMPAMRTIYRSAGVRGFFHGLPAEVLHTVLWHSFLPVNAYYSKSRASQAEPKLIPKQ